MIYLLVVQTGKDVSFATKELAGNGIFAGLRAEEVALIALSQGRAGPAALAAAAEAVDRQDAAGMNATDAAAKAAGAIKTALAQPKGSPAGAYDGAIDAVLDHIARVEDGSNLTLDPDLDSYYAQDIALVKMPALVAAASRVLDAAAALGKGQPTPEAIVGFLTRKGEFATVLGGVESDIAAGERGNSDGTMTPALAPAYQRLVATAATFAKALDGVPSSGDARPAPDSLVPLQATLQAAAEAFWQATGEELDHLLAARVSGLNTRMGWNLALVAAVFLGSLGFAWRVARSISLPLLDLHHTMHAVAGGDTGVTVPYVDRRDEVGVMAGDVEIFRQGLVAAGKLAETQEVEHAAKAAEMARLSAAAARFEAGISGVVDKVASSAADMESTAQSLTVAARQASGQASAVAGAAIQATGNVQTVAAAAEELSASIAEIARRVADAADMSQVAADETGRTNAMVLGLTQSADRIGEVVMLINDIAAQTNLLALNATIEAARAGEAGKGFAVVANEVKGLAAQTARATDEIGNQITAVQEETRRAVDAIRKIGGVIDQVREISASIATAIEEQGAATAEIARNVQEAASGTQDVSANITGVTQAVTSSGEAAGSVLTSAGDLARSSQVLKREVAGFLAEVRAA